ncbi:hypothetical protein FZ103_12680 [Streptomonospora sp. PA3]|uniref:hypothetical protein n=1 Tax=Streptomonospora sp. PA3 TaxID=2607326 RepID=UPI0012DEC3C4|nr:hypothetical protein [Streptomonospora sp. PA3]MUL42021.1 hypothetical protein [Streptomonospora sp. PA3]
MADEADVSACEARSGAWSDTGPLAPLTWPVQRRVLALAHSWQAGDRLADIVPAALEGDPRLQTVYTVPDGSAFAPSGAEFLRRTGAVVLPWDRARAHRFDLAVATHLGGLDDVRAPVLFLPHGVGFSKLVPRRPGYGPPARRPVGGAVAGALVRYGRVAPAVIGIAHERQCDVISAEVPEAARICRVIGDPALDRMLASRALRSAYRRALGVSEHQRLIVASSTWGGSGLVGRHPELLTRLPEELGGDYVAAAVLHPAIWWVHGPRQIAAWLAGAQEAGLRLLAPGAAWQAALVAADAVVGDNGSVTVYGAALGHPTLLAAGDPADVVPGSQVAELYRRARRLRPDEPLREQIEVAAERRDPEHGRVIAGLLTSAPGCSARLLGECAYALMDCAEPARPPVAQRLPEPQVLRRLVQPPASGDAPGRVS